MRASWGVTSRNAIAFTFKRVRKDWFNYDGMRKLSVVDKNGQRQSYRFKLC